jgi:hypothetical protein
VRCYAVIMLVVLACLVGSRPAHAMEFQTLPITTVQAILSGATVANLKLGDKLCPDPGPGECVYRHYFQATAVVNNIGCKLKGDCSEVPAHFMTKHTQKIAVTVGTDPTSPYGILRDTIALRFHNAKEHEAFVQPLISGTTSHIPCDLKAICFEMNYGDFPQVRWSIDQPIRIEVHPKIAAAKIPIILDFRGYGGQQTVLSTIKSDGTFTNIPAAQQSETCGITFAGAKLFVGGITVTQMPGDGICDKDGSIFESVNVVGVDGDGLVLDGDDGAVMKGTFSQNGGDGVVVNGNNTTMRGNTTNQNGKNGIVLNGSHNTVEDHEALSNGAYGLVNGEGTTGNRVVNSHIAGNVAGNISDPWKTLVIENVDTSCDEGCAALVPVVAPSESTAPAAGSGGCGCIIERRASRAQSMTISEALLGFLFLLLTLAMRLRYARYAG